MNTGADDDSRSTPTFAFSASSALASGDAASAIIASRLANASRAYPGRALRARVYCVIKFPPSLSQPFGDALILPDKSSLLFQLVLQFANGNVTRDGVATQRQRRRGARGLPHHKTGAGDARRRLAVTGHRGATPGHQQIVDAFRRQHAIRQ